MTKYLIIDDEFIAHEIIKGYCDLLPNLKLMKNCYDALEAIDYLNKDQVDLIFLDLNMPKLKGFEFLRTLPAPPKVIVTTAHIEFAIDGYELNVVDYLLKPFSFERFLKAVNKAVGTFSSSTTQTGIENKKSTIFLRDNKKFIQVVISDILFLESAGNYSKVVTQARTITVRDKVVNILSALPPNDFIQVHKSFAVAKQHIQAIEGNKIMIDKQVIPIGKTYKLNVMQLLK